MENLKLKIMKIKVIIDIEALINIIIKTLLNTVN